MKAVEQEHTHASSTAVLGPILHRTGRGLPADERRGAHVAISRADIAIPA